MELDGYNIDLRLAFEYQGIQHRKKAFGITDDELKNIQKEDALKLKLCKKNGVTLIQIPDDGHADEPRRPRRERFQWN